MQIRVSIPFILHDKLKKKADLYGLSMSAYIKNLVVQDMRDDDRPIQQSPIKIIETVKRFVR